MSRIDKGHIGVALFMVERNVAEGDSAERVADQSRQLNSADGTVFWQHTYRTRNKIYTLYQATTAEQLRRLALRQGYLIHRLARIEDEIQRTDDTSCHRQ